MANVVTAFTLPVQPATGTVQRFALGGDGYRSPSGVYVIRDVAALGDGTGAGHLTVQMGLDPNFVSMLGYVSLSISQATPATNRVKFQHVGALVATMQRNILLNFTNGNIVPEIAETWLPPAALIPGVSPGTTSVFVDNTGTDLLLFNASVFLYDIRAMENFPIDLLVAARGGI